MLRELVTMVGGDPAAMVRVELDDTSVEAVVAHLLEHPADMQRPIAVLGSRAIIGRPSELVLELLA
ncbi:MAG: ArsC/Spx/MgsR family protein [Acidimicrobiales bacterium]